MNDVDGSLVLRQQLFTNLAQLCVDQRVRNFIISPGSRSAPLTLAFARHPEIQCRIVYDERSAAYVALGLAQQTRQPVGLVCTSGTAALNYGPAVAEAYYQQVPLLIFTADRPPEWIDQQDNQSLHQPDLYLPHCRGSFVFPVDVRHPDSQWHVNRIVSEALYLVLGLTPGPVHINVPLREPLYVKEQETNSSISQARTISVQKAELNLSEANGETVVATWRQAKRKLIVVGMYPPSHRLQEALRQLRQDPTVAIIGDMTSNLKPDVTPLHQADMILGTQDVTAKQALRPDLVVSFGGPLVSKYLKLYLRQNKPQEQWHILPSGNAPDTYQCLTHVLHMEPVDFLAQLSTRITESAHRLDHVVSGDLYATHWQHMQEQASRALKDFLEKASFGEFVAVHRVLQALPDQSRLQLGNSMPIRYANFIGYLSGWQPGAIHSNRGVSGIDGTVSTAVGAALADEVPTTLIVGDLAFFYDRNGLWHQHLPPNLRIVVLNNHGGGIFDLIDGPNRLPSEERATYFLTPQNLSAQRTAADHGCDYFHCQDDNSLRRILPNFFAKRQAPALLEIETDMVINTTVFEQFKTVAAKGTYNRGGGVLYYTQ
ncbi:2-succinyl-5-enolpyruvyl-6-hydroxy-3-cyclohexene-1-carboxylic-acid synthase [Chloroflexi bacterium TSY]|nr:2-succinyl-5-enolpyruvyl-6-hydroxy-3-cyclohexene-1-carboxylic-acid synthase [Chloroflexi bacterium TSY]